MDGRSPIHRQQHGRGRRCARLLPLRNLHGTIWLRRLSIVYKSAEMSRVDAVRQRDSLLAYPLRRLWPSCHRLLQVGVGYRRASFTADSLHRLSGGVESAAQLLHPFLCAVRAVVHLLGDPAALARPRVQSHRRSRQRRASVQVHVAQSGLAMLGSDGHPGCSTAL